MNPSTLTTAVPSKPADSAHRVPWPTSDERPEAARTAAPQSLVGVHRSDPDPAVLVMHGGNEGNATPGLVAGDTLHPWGGRLRETVQRRPLTAVATAFVLGAVLLRIAR